MLTLGTRVRVAKGATASNSSVLGADDEGRGRNLKKSFADQRRMENSAAVSVRVDREIV